MTNIRSISSLIFAVMVQNCGSGTFREQTVSPDDNMYSYEFPYTVESNEVRDTSFALPRAFLNNPIAFMKILTDVQMAGRRWTDTYNYPEKLMYGDSILRDICRRVENSNGVPVYLVEEICCAEIVTYTLSMREKGEKSYNIYDYESIHHYDISKRQVSYEHGNIWPISKSFRELVDEWDREQLLQIGVVDNDEDESWEGCVTRLTLGIDSVYVDMIKLSIAEFMIIDQSNPI